MRELRLLLRLQRVNALRRNEIRHTRDRRQRLRLLWMLVLYVVLAAMGLFYATAISWGIYTAGLAAMLPGMAITLAAAATVMGTVIRAQGLLFDARGWEHLAPLPIHHSTVVWARLLDLYGSALGFCLMVMLPATVFYSMAEGLAALPVWLAIWLFTPLIPLGLGLVIAAG
ncbi:MAG: hypothetical protein GXY32_00045, partial [Ruminococcaceae bacterium]|nr:hypothetical protein [Oscillospiraceae bacterium]